MTSGPIRNGSRRRTRDEANLPTQYPEACQAAWLPASYVHEGRPSCGSVAPDQGPKATVGLIWRIRDRNTFERLRAEASTVRAGAITVKYLLDQGDDPPRLGFAVPRKFGSAVERNRVRRQARAAISELGAAAVPSGSYLVMIHPPVRGREYALLKADLARLFGRVVA
jgi:ribonuclease P protein component